MTTNSKEYMVKYRAEHREELRTYRREYMRKWRKTHNKRSFSFKVEPLNIPEKRSFTFD